jgi:hypothetical protein
MATDLPGCGEADKLAALQRVLVDFCRRSRVWRVDLDVAMAADAVVGALVWPCDAEAISVDKIYYDGVLLPVGNACFYSAALGRNSDGEQTLTLSQTPIASVAWTMRVSGTLIPAGSALEVSDWILDRYGDVIVDGATAILKMHARKPYSDPAGAGVATSSYRRGVAYACLDGARSVGRGS